MQDFDSYLRQAIGEKLGKAISIEDHYSDALLNIFVDEDRDKIVNLCVKAMSDRIFGYAASLQYNAVAEELLTERPDLTGPELHDAVIARIESTEPVEA